NPSSSLLSRPVEPHAQLHGVAFGRSSPGELPRQDLRERVMTIVGELLDRDFKKPIEEIIKVNNVDEETVYSELTEYIATNRIKAEYEHLFRAMADAPKTPSADSGVWISGFFGSGKSSFAKNLGYVLANKTVLGQSASKLFIDQVKSRKVREFVEFLNA